MAYVEGHPGKKVETSMMKHAFFMIISSISLVAFMLYTSDDPASDLMKILFIVAVVLAVSVLVSVKLNPLGWKRIFNRSEYERIIEIESMVIEKLNELDDSYFVINDFSFELLRVEHLIISENGFFVLAKSPKTGNLRVEGNTLYAGDYSLEKATAGLWRVCHLINILIRKGFNNLEIMPKPVLILPESGKPALTEFDGITIAGIDDLNNIITKKIKFKIEKETADGFAYFIKGRYIR
ncbi:MAG TPA: hypothetical protein P5120_07575 [Spirochaetota bacterium]|nr:hypothetical protein [Spirochaetota bacterium]HPF06197.1 hypothetical protein [Spirochaetota bacterium]HPJ42499.1 hypothetical protein [Spirochaetota bacterium]HPR36413.1 hypothetical protein [Spirochaetota bacterium]HRX47363.1 hypothetical protein [Spirochaetota bacterium]